MSGRCYRVGIWALVLAAVVSATPLLAADPPPPSDAPFSLEKRVPWTSSRVHGTPGPADPYQTEVVFPDVKFFEPLEIAVVPGMNRLLVAERKGKLYTFENKRDARPELLLDVNRTVYGVAAHPKFFENGYVFATSIVDATEGAPKGTRVSRFTVKNLDGQAAPKADLASEKIVFEWPYGGHNGGCLRFGPDGFLYISTGDGSGIADSLESGQNASDVLGALLRIDVDRDAGGGGYAIPPDNPFAGRKDLRGEVWAYGLRQLWKFSWDAKTGRLWGGDVGQDLWEEINLITRGGNYGWSLREGEAPFRPNRPAGPTPLIGPVLVQPHSEFRSLTGGYVYHGTRLPELAGTYLYGDYDTGKIWAMRYENDKVTKNWQLADTQLRIIAFVEDANREVLVLDFIGGQVHRLVPAPPTPADAPKFPTKLSETGLFASTKAHTPAAGLIPYDVNSPLWSDGAEKERFIALPGDSRIEFETETYPQPAPGAPPGWRFPAETVLVKTFSLEMEAGNPKSNRRLETRLLHFKPMPGTDEVGAQFWRGYTYLWNEDQTDAELLDGEGLSKTFQIKDAKAAGGKREQVYRFPSRSECTMCHTFSAKYALGLDTRQMNRTHDYGGGKVLNQLEALQQMGVFREKLPKQAAALPRLVDHRDLTKPIDDRARSYLHSNCAHCHRKWGGGNADFQLLQTLPLAETGTLNTPPGQGKFDLADPRILVPGDPARSLVLHRMKLLGPGRMPHIASHTIDEEAVKLLEEWIKAMPKEGDSK